MTTSPITIIPATPAMLPALVKLMRRQELRQHRQDARLSVRTALARVAEVTAALSPTGPNAAQPLVAVDAQGQVRGSVESALWELSEHSALLAFLTRRNGTARHLLVPAPQERNAPAVVHALLTALTAAWRREGVSADLIRWPSCDAWLTPLLGTHGFHLDSVCALHPVPDLLPTQRADAALRCIQQAHPDDEVALLMLFREEVHAHEPVVPSGCLRPGALIGFRAALHRMWSGGGLEEGAPFVLVCEQDRQVVGMAEVSLLTVKAGDEPGFTPPGCYICLDNVCVHDEVRGQGVGRQLVQAVFDVCAARSLGVDGSLLWYNPDNVQAARFWGSMGFHPLWTTYQRLHDPT